MRDWGLVSIASARFDRFRFSVLPQQIRGEQHVDRSSNALLSLLEQNRNHSFTAFSDAACIFSYFLMHILLRIPWKYRREKLLVLIISKLIIIWRLMNDPHGDLLATYSKWNCDTHEQLDRDFVRAALGLRLFTSRTKAWLFAYRSVFHVIFSPYFHLSLFLSSACGLFSYHFWFFVLRCVFLAVNTSRPEI